MNLLSAPIRKSLISRRRIDVQGIVQGVGFRPFVYRLATELKLSGGVHNTPRGVTIEIEGTARAIEQFSQRLPLELPPHASLRAVEQQGLPTQRDSSFEIWPSEINSAITGAQLLPDLATCPDCLQDTLDPANRRYRYPFTNCTNCGPRYSIITALPYDRPHTTMRTFSMCPDCAAEYADPLQRRFHAQPNACDRCGPTLSFRLSEEQHCSHSDRDALNSSSLNRVPLKSFPLDRAIASLNQGHIIALKGLGGFQLLVDAQNAQAVERLRQRKHRPDKPLALMYPTIETVRRHCEVSEAAEALLTSAQAPIVLLPRRTDINGTPDRLADSIAPNNPYLGVMLPTTPLHHLLLQQHGKPVVATSGNLSGEPICINEQIAIDQLAPIADAFLLHNRPIQRPVDDSVVQLIRGQPQTLRHARGYAPQRFCIDTPLARKVPKETCILALGGHLKNAIALSTGSDIILSQHIGDLIALQARVQLQQTVDDFLSLHHLQVSAIACDLHPDYGSTLLAQTLAKRWQLPMITAQHHYAHILSCMADNQLQPPALGIAWDGTGHGLDQTVWGGEFLQINENSFERVAHFLPYPLPGGEMCSLEPRRSALGLLYSCYGDAAFEMTDLAPMQSFTKSQLVMLRKMLDRNINAPVTSSVGRLFDGISSLLNLHHYVSFEGQAALTVQFAATQSPVKSFYPFVLIDTQPCAIDWRPMVRAIVEDYREAVMTPVIAAKFHNTLVEIMVAIAQQTSLSQVVMAGGCFQNNLLVERAIQRLSAAGFRPYWPQRIPPNDGGLAVGQVMAAWRDIAHA